MSLSQSANRKIVGVGLFILSASFPIMLFQNCSGGFSALTNGIKSSSLSSIAPVAKTFTQLQSDPTCPTIRWKFNGFQVYSPDSIVPFGDGAYRYGDPNAPFMRGPGLAADFAPQMRATGYVATSNDCGVTWKREDETVPPILMEGSAGNNGVLHFAEDSNAGPLNRAFVSRYRWDGQGGSVIYPVFWTSHAQWGYQLGSADLPRPVIGDLSPGHSVDNFYSPSVSARNDDDSVFLYFGGWRKDYSRHAIPNCPDMSSAGLANYQSDLCRCDYSNNGLGIDACTGDKIFVASNSPSIGSINRLHYKIYQGGGQWSPDGWDSTQFEPVITAKMLNACHDSDPVACPFFIRHTNDPTVVATPNGSGGTMRIMYFTGETPINASSGANYTHVALSGNGLDWGAFHALRAAPGVVLPGGSAFNNANGSARIFFNPIRNQLYMITQFAADAPEFAGSPDSAKSYLLRMDLGAPWTVLEVRELDKRVFTGNWDASGLNNCAVTGLCAQSKLVSGTSNPIRGNIDGVVTSNGHVSVIGWACAAWDSNAVGVHAYVGGPAGSGSFAVASVANLASEDAVGAACGDPNLRPHRFSIPLDSVLASSAGKPIFIHGLANDGSGWNSLITGSGAFTVPSRASSQPVVGFVDAVWVSGAQAVVSGWACTQGTSSAIDVHLYLGGAAGVGRFAGAVTANAASENEVDAACGDSEGVPHRFNLSVDRASTRGQSVYVHGISNVGGVNSLLAQSGAFVIP